MNNIQKAALVIGIIIAAALAVVDIFLTFIVLMTDGVLAVCFIMYNTSARFAVKPEITGYLRGDAKAIILKNTGNDRAEEIHTSIVPHDIEFKTPSLNPGETCEHPLESMLKEGKCYTTYRNSEEKEFAHTNMLSSLDDEEDLLKPMFPTFAWK